MRGLYKSKRISWAPDVNLCQERLFLSEECPSQVGLGGQDHLQAKSSWSSHSNGIGGDDILPPGFEGGHPPNQFQVNLSEIPIIKWKCPPRFQLDINWQVVAGEESKEVEIQNQRERRALEAVYPRPSAIPPNPTVSMDVEQTQYNDQQTLLIPVTPIEDEEAAADTPSALIAPFSIPISSQPPVLASGIPSSTQVSIPSIANTIVCEKPASGMALGVDPDVVAAASAALTQISKSNEHGNLIDHDLLIKLLSNPKSIEKLVTDYGGASNAQNVPKPTLPAIPVSDHHLPAAVADTSSVRFCMMEASSPSLVATLPTDYGGASKAQNVAKPTLPSILVSDHHPPAAVSDPSSVRFSMMETSSHSLVANTSNGPFYPQTNGGVGVGHHPNSWIKPPGVVPASSSLSVGPSQPKDLNYYKNLIQRHGGDRQEPSQQFGSRFNHQQGTNQELVNNPKPRDSKPKIKKPCLYFNSSRGCRHGANCAFQHDTSSQQRGNNVPEGQNAKRTKMDRQLSS